MKKIAFCFILVLLFSNNLIAQTPSWSVNENTYQYTMTFLAKLNANGKQLINPNDKVAAFVGSSCRGISGITYVASEKNYYAYLTVFSNTQGEAISFKLYDSATDKITTVTKQIVFALNEHKGNLFQSYSIAEPALNNTAKILMFDFADIKTVSSVITSNKVDITLYNNYSLTDLKPVFTLSKGGRLFKNNIEQKSNEIADNFSSAITYEVLSEDESILTNYVVTLNQISIPTVFYKKDAVCYAGGAIKVVSSQEGATVAINSNGKTIIAKKITNGEALFTDLEIDSYIVSIGEELKLINITLKSK
ncbi:hypothetical protein BST83_00060 [Polaribacter filamentus]|uniref:Uncharacterized protein n=1 Tax=Polaribacter filamentus TaxID=53483 RepID=A0A2S7L2E7_9FLAO|nr:hypothetical protein [Polaribacter filamentus]PQB06774.1 hypothetical protein BST83_06095 [Polaribacter filamentus]PQB09085.1 hypothetical protein BST83_00060 [Polaribacter filamentus]